MIFLAYSQWMRARWRGSFALSNSSGMQTKQTIAIIGATGNMGSAISKSLAKGNYRLLLKANDQEKLQALVQEIHGSNSSADVEGIECPKDASWEADIIIAAVPYEAEKEVAEKIREVANQKIVISITNPLNETYNGIKACCAHQFRYSFQRLCVIACDKSIRLFAVNYRCCEIGGKSGVECFYHF